MKKLFILIFIAFVAFSCSSQGPKPNEIWYTSSNGDVVIPTSSDVFKANIVSNIYENGKGIIMFDNDVTSIGERAFYNCTSLTSITIGNGVTSIGSSAFFECSSLTSVTIPDSVTSIGYQAFYKCTSLTSVDISDLSAWCKISFGNGFANPLRNGAKLYLNGNELTDITIPSDITEIKAYAFYGCTSLTSVTIPDSVTSIGYEAFFYCSSLTSITIPDSVSSIGGYAFYDCTSLTSVTIPDSVTSIGSSAFRECSSLTSVYCKPTTPPTTIAYSWGGWSAFNNNASGRKIYVPRNSVEAYKAASYWSEYKAYIEGYDF